MIDIQIIHRDIVGGHVEHSDICGEPSTAVTHYLDTIEIVSSGDPNIASTITRIKFIEQEDGGIKIVPISGHIIFEQKIIKGNESWYVPTQPTITVIQKEI
jgi:hypothetical protein